MTVLAHDLNKTAAPSYSSTGLESLWMKGDLVVADMAVIADIIQLVQLPDKCRFPAHGGQLNLTVFLTDYDTFSGEIVLSDEDGSNLVVLGTITAAAPLTEVDFSAVDATELFYAAGGKWLGLKATTAIATVVGTVEVAAQYASGVKKFTA